MASFDYQQLRADARQRLAGYGKAATGLVVLHAGVSLGISLVSTAINYILDMGIAQTGGLGGMDARTTLETIQTLLTCVQMGAMPFWQIGYIFVVLAMARNCMVQRKDLLMGFRFFGPVLRGQILRGVILFLAMMLGSQAGSLLFMLTPAAKDMLLLTGDAEATLESLMSSDAYLQSMLPAIPFMLGGVLLLVTPVYYRLRMMDYVLMDEPRAGALYAMLRSIQITKKQCLALFRLDLRFWWFYLLQLLTVMLCYGDLLLPLLGVELGMSAVGASYLFYALALVAELALYAWKRNQVFVTYALVYEELRERSNTAVHQMPEPEPKNVPWNY